MKLFFDPQRSKVLTWYSLRQKDKGWKNFTLRVYYTKFPVLHILQVYISNKAFAYCSMKKNEVVNNNGASYAIVLGSPMTQSGHLVELTSKR